MIQSEANEASEIGGQLTLDADFRHWGWRGETVPSSICYRGRKDVIIEFPFSLFRLI